METNSVSRSYETRRSTRAKEVVTKSRVDWNRTKRNRVFDSEEEDDEITSASEEETPTSSEDEVEEGESAVNESKEEATVSVNDGKLPVIEAGCDGTTEEDAEEESVVPGKCKRSRLSVLYDSDGSDDSCVVRKVFAKRSCIIDEEDSPAEQEQRRTSPAEEEAKRKQTRLMKLQELSQRRSTRAESVRNHPEDVKGDALILEDSCPSSLSPTEISDSSDDDSMKDFIVEEEDGKEWKGEESEDGESQPQEKKHAVSSKELLLRHVPGFYHVPLSVHLERIVRAFLINAADDTFLISLHEGKRQKNYAQEMLTSFHQLDERFIQPRLDSLLSRSRWKERYKERVDTYPDMHIIFGNPQQRACQACELQRYCKLTVVLSGKSYDSNTMEIDDFMSHDKQRLKVGSVCGSRTEVYHNLKHFKYKLYQECCGVTKDSGFRDEPLKETVDRIMSQLKDDGWIQKRYTDLEGYMNDADFFQEEKMD